MTNILGRYMHGAVIDEDLSLLRNSTASYYHADDLGSITSLSNSAGALANTYTYDAFGKVTASTGTLSNPFQFTGREVDQEIGIYGYRARYFDQNVGRFVSEDPIRFKGGINLFSYVANSPIGYRDPLGLRKQKPYDVLAAHGRNPNSIPGLCHPTPCLQGCLESLFGQVLPVHITPYSNNPAALAGYAISGYATIDLPGSCDSFFSSNYWVLHEYYHVVYQWQDRPALFELQYFWEALMAGGNHDAIPSEQQADAFADGPAYQVLSSCLKNCKCKK